MSWVSAWERAALSAGAGEGGGYRLGYLINVGVILTGLFAVVFNRRFARSSVVSSREFFGIELPEGTRRHRFTIIYSRVICIATGSLMVVLGTLDLLAAGWRD